MGMIVINMDIPEYCARCPLMVVHRGEDFMPTYFCKYEWKKLEQEYICKKRSDCCPMKELVRCKDCKWHKPYGNCDYGNKPDDWFCADGVKRDE